MIILLIEPFFGASHAQWASGYQKNSQHTIHLLTLPAFHWKWRMHGAAVTLAQQFLELEIAPDVILVSDMLDLCTFQALTKSKTHSIPFVIYFHENQITYPWSPTDSDVKLKRNNQYGFINYTSALASDGILFNSLYHKNSFLGALPKFLRQFPDYKNLETIDSIREKSKVLHLGVDLQAIGESPMARDGAAVLLWNHRWEYDKNPDIFFHTLYRLKEEGIPFRLIVLGQSFPKSPSVFAEAKKRLSEEIIHFGYTKSREDYINYLHHADILPVTSQQDFFGGSVVEAIYCNCFPLLPKRLAYPEHIPKEVHSIHFYPSEEIFYPMLKEAILTIEEIRQKSYRHFIEHYDWKVLASKYDDYFIKKVEN